MMFAKQTLVSVLLNAVDRYARIGIRALPRTERSARYSFNMLCLIGACSATCYAALYMAMGFTEMAAWSFPCSAIAGLPLVARYSERLSILLGTVVIVSIFVALTYYAGRDSLLHVFILLLGVNGVILRGSKAWADVLLVFTVSCSAIIYCHVTFVTPALGDRISDGFVEFLAIANILATLTMVFGVLLILKGQVTHAQEALASEHARSEALLDNLLPTEIAERLKSAPGEVIADDLSEVTILFADIADFTPRASTMPAEEVVAFLNQVFTEFDRLTDHFGLEKIKTIGDAYMVAAGMPKPRADHAQVIADMALAMVEVTARLSKTANQPIEVRIGLHSGSAIAGVIGTQKVFYDVWGDTVNTASRMESHGEVGRIQLTDKTRELLGDAYEFERRGTIEIKGKGAVNTFWLLGAAPDAVI